ncbi:MAG: 3-isopropylmalate dehydratase small subunit [Peptococcaceae bacterium]
MNNYIIRGHVHKFGDNINTDLISPAQYIGLADEIMIAHAMEGADPDFPRKVKPGDIIVAGKNFGSGSSRETAPLIIKGSGISVVIAEFFARIFYRNAINIGLSVLTTDCVAEINTGDELEVDPLQGTIHNMTIGRKYQCTKLPEHIMELVHDGGLINHLEKKLKA